MAVLYEQNLLAVMAMGVSSDITKIAGIPEISDFYCKSFLMLLLKLLLVQNFGK